jgi:hypothetical protein
VPVALTSWSAKLVQRVRFEDGYFVPEDYPEGTTVHGIDGSGAKELRRLFVFAEELHDVVRWLALIPSDLKVDPTDQTLVFTGLAEAALIAFCRCFDSKSKHPFIQLKPKDIFSPEQRAQLKRIKTIRNKLVAHDERLYKSVFSLIILSKERTAIEAKSAHLHVRFLFLPDLNNLRTLSQVVLDWVEKEFRRVEAEIVRYTNAKPLSERAAYPPFPITTEERDFFAPEAAGNAKQDQPD